VHRNELFCRDLQSTSRKWILALENEIEHEYGRRSAARTGKNSGAQNKSETGLQERSSDWHETWGNGTAKTQAGEITAREKEIRAETLSGKDEDLRADRAEERAGSLAAKSERDLTEERDCS
jgi:hypothetical protein